MSLVTVEEPFINEIVPREDTARREIETLVRKKYTHPWYKPIGFDSVEIRSIGDNKYRVNILCKRYVQKGDFFPSTSIPISYYVIDKNGDYEFSPAL